jgi:adenylate kinase
MKIKKFDQFTDKIIPCVLFVGPPGCGKGTQSKILSEKTGFLHVSTGEILRDSKNPKIKSMMKTGELLPDDIVAGELENFIKENKNSPGFIFDGYPRNIKQKGFLENLFSKNGLEILNVFYLNVPEEKLKERIKERSKTSGREDDSNPKAFENRMKEYEEKTLPMINSFKKSKSFYEIDGTQELEEITENILDLLNEI